MAGFQKETTAEDNDPLYIQWDEVTEAFISEILPGVHLVVSEEAYHQSEVENKRYTDDNRVMYWLTRYLCEQITYEMNTKPIMVDSSPPSVPVIVPHI